MKDLFVILVSHKRFFTDIGGIESMAKLLIRKIFLHRVPIGLVCQGPNLSKFVWSDIVSSSLHIPGANIESCKNPSFLRKNNYPFLLYVIKEIIFSAFAMLSTLKIIKKARRKGLTPIIHAFDTVYGGLAAAFASRISGAPLLSQTHGLRQIYIRSVTKNKFIHALDYYIEKFVIRNSIFLISVNKEALNFWALQGVGANKLQLVRVPIDLKVFKADPKQRRIIREKLGIDEKVFTICFVGRLSPEKNVETLLHAFARARLKNLIPENSKLLIVGDGPLMNKLKKLAVSLMLAGNLIFTGFRSDVSLLMNGMDVLVLPSSIEGNPTVVLEAMATEVPVIASCISAHIEVISHLQNGLLFKDKRIDELTNIFSLVYRNNKLLKQLGRAGRSYVRGHNDVDKIIQRLEELYARTISSTYGA